MGTTSLPDPRPLAAARLAFAAGIATAAIGALALAGWIWDIRVFKTVYGPITMKANAAIGFVLCGVSLALGRRAPALSAVCAAAAGLIGALTLLEHVAGWNLHIDQLLFAEAPGAAATTSPNRMGPNGASSFVLASFALCCLAAGGARAASVAQRVSSLALMLPFVALAGYIYGAEELYDVARLTGIALHTAVAFALLNIGILAARTDVAPASVFVSDSPAGTMLRRLAVPVILVPLVLGYFEIVARRADLIDRGMGLALYTMTLILVFGLTIWHTARVIERSDAARRAAEHDRDLLIASERQARADAERSNRLKDQFLATLSHELRTPLNVMLGWTQILERGVNPAENARIAGVVARNGRLLARLVGDLLDISRVTTAQFEIFRSPIVLNDIVAASIDEIRPLADEKGICLRAELAAPPEPIEADGERLQQIVWNLLSNAVKFTGPGGHMMIRTSAASDAVCLSVADTGIGFDQAFASELFKPFRQADSSVSREHGGLGLGLSIAKHLAELHGGSLTASSGGTGKGATFTLQLPRMPRSVSAAAAPESVSAGHHSLT